MAPLNWKNPYIDLIETKPTYLIPCSGRICTAQDVLLLKHRAEKFQSIFCELGSGSGGHLIELALRYPSTLCVGFEIQYKRAFRTAEKAERAKINNLIVLRTDARALPSCFPPSSLDGVIVNFPDPWLKRRWKKHRLLNPEFVLSLAKLLKPQAFFLHKTDNYEYFCESYSNILASRAFLISGVSRDLYRSPLISNNISTEFESLFRHQGLPVHLLLAKKISE